MCYKTKLNFWSLVLDLRDITHSGDDDLIGLGVTRGRGRGRDMQPWAVQVLDALLVVRAELQGVGEGVVGGHDRPGLLGVLQTQDVAKLVGGHLEEVRAWEEGRGRRPHGFNHPMTRW